MDAGEFGPPNLAQLNFGAKEYGDLTNPFSTIATSPAVPCSILAYTPVRHAPVYGEPARRGRVSG